MKIKYPVLVVLFGLVISLGIQKSIADTGKVKCHMTFTLSGWSFFYKSASGDGTITCSNGQKADVKLRAHGGGVTFGKSKIKNGTGTFSKVSNISELYGSYGGAEGHAGAGKSASGRGLTKGDVSLTLSGSGSGVDLGFDFGSFKISPKK